MHLGAWPNAEDVVLVNAVRDLSAPYGPPSELVGVSAFSEQNVALTQAVSTAIFLGYSDGLHVTENQMSVLDVGDPHVGHRHHRLSIVALALRHTRCDL